MKLLKTVLRERETKITAANERLINESGIRVDENNDFLVHTGKVMRYKRVKGMDLWKLTAIQLRCRSSPYGHAEIYDVLLDLGYESDFYHLKGRKKTKKSKAVSDREARIEKLETFLGNFKRNIGMKYPRLPTFKTVRRGSSRAILVTVDSTAGIEYRSQKAMTGKISVKKGEEQKSLMFKDTFAVEEHKKDSEFTTSEQTLINKLKRK